MSVTIVLPPVSDDQVSADLRWLTQVLVESGHADEYVGGVLGGDYGYGVHFTNDTFEMHPYFWGDCQCGHEEAEAVWCEGHDHAPTCYQQVIRARGFLDYDDDTDLSYEQRQAHNEGIVSQVCAEMGLDGEYGTYVHCTCTYTADYAAWVEANPHEETCGIVVPNFRHKPSGSTVCFYKYLGRGMETDLRAPWFEILRDCVDSLNTPTPTA